MRNRYRYTKQGRRGNVERIVNDGTPDERVRSLLEVGGRRRIVLANEDGTLHTWEILRPVKPEEPDLGSVIVFTKRFKFNDRDYTYAAVRAPRGWTTTGVQDRLARYSGWGELLEWIGQDNWESIRLLDPEGEELEPEQDLPF